MSDLPGRNDACWTTGAPATRGAPLPYDQRTQPRCHVAALAPKFATGQLGDVARRLSQLDFWVRERVEVGDIASRSITEDYDSPDGVPFAGELAKKSPRPFTSPPASAAGVGATALRRR